MKPSVKVGRVYRCPVCGAEAAVILARSQELDLHCCNVPMRALKKALKVYFCETCGAETMVIREKDATSLELSCCNKPMTLRPYT